MHSNVSAKLLWTNRNSATGTTLTASGNSGAPAIDLRYAATVWLAVNVGAAPSGNTPTLDVYLDVQDAAGNWITQVLHANAQLAAAGAAYGSAGLYLPTGAGLASIVLPEYGRVSWSVGGTGSPTFTQTVISLYGR